MNSIYTAIMKAADSIERHPDLFNFQSTRLPEPSCGTPGCALGWIGAHLGHEGYCIAGVAVKLGLHLSYQFYERMGQLCGDSEWKRGPAVCAATLRLYAAKYHAPAHTGLPDIVREIFTNPRQTISDTAMDQKFA